MAKTVFLTPAQAAESLNISPKTLKKLIKNKNIRVFKTPGGHHRIHRGDLMESLCGQTGNGGTS